MPCLDLSDCHARAVPCDECYARWSPDRGGPDLFAVHPRVGREATEVFDTGTEIAVELLARSPRDASDVGPRGYSGTVAPPCLWS
jgi:hypothetical protein